MAMVTPTKTPAVVEIERLGFRWKEESQYDLDQLSEQRRVQVREAHHYAPKDVTETFAAHMTQTAFPAIVVTSDGWIVDGNTRVGAAKLLKRKHFPAVVLEVEYAGPRTTRKQQNELSALAATLNQMGGMRLTAKELRRVTKSFIELGWKSEQIARAIGVPPARIGAAKRELDAMRRLERVGLDANRLFKTDKEGNLTQRGTATLRALGHSAVQALNDVPFRALAELAAAADLNAKEIVGAAKEARETGSETGQNEVMARLRTEMGDRIRAKELTGVAKPPASAQLRQHLGFVRKYVGTEQELLETDPAVGDMHIEVLEESMKVLGAVLEMQRPR